MRSKGQAAALWLVTVLSTLAVEATTIAVDTTADVNAADGHCSLREAISAANSDIEPHGAQGECPAGNGADVITLGAGFYALSSDLPALGESVEIRGAGQLDTVIDGQGLYQLLLLASYPTPEVYVVEHLTLQYGVATSGGAINVFAGVTVTIRDVFMTGNEAITRGGGVFVASGSSWPTTVRIEHSLLTFNEAPGLGGGIGVDADGEVILRIVDSTISANRTPTSGGGIEAITDGGRLELEIRRSTITGNSAEASGGALFIDADDGLVWIRDSTIVGNIADADGSHDNGTGGGIASVGAIPVTLRNSIVAQNEDLVGTGYVHDVEGALASDGHNFIGINNGAKISFPAGYPNVNQDYVGTAAAPLDPLLMSQGNYGGATSTMMPDLAAGSPVIDAGNCPGEPYDQRFFGNAAGGTRIVDNALFANAGDGCDIGAVEAGAVDLRIFASGFESGSWLDWSAAVQ